MIAQLLYSPLSLGLEAVFLAMVPDEADGSWLDRLESSGAAGSLAAELLQAGPPYLLSWALLDVVPAADVALPRRHQPLPAPLSAGWPAPVADPAAKVPPSKAPPTVPTAPYRSSAPSAPLMPTGSPHALAPPDAPAIPDSPTPPADTPALAAPQRAAEALGWPAALGDEVLWVSADLHYLHVVTGLGRATVLDSLSAVEARFGAAGLRIHRSHWVARRAIRRVARGAHGWRCELLAGQRLPISRRRVAVVRAAGPRLRARRQLIRPAGVACALVEPGGGRHGAPPWFADPQRGKALCWRVLAFELERRPIGGSEWRALVLR